MRVSVDKIIHYIKRRRYAGNRYLCNQACSITKEKATKNVKEVTCKNCKRKIVTGGVK